MHRNFSAAKRFSIRWSQRSGSAARRERRGIMTQHNTKPGLPSIHLLPPLCFIPQNNHCPARYANFLPSHLNPLTCQSWRPVNQGMRFRLTWLLFRMHAHWRDPMGSLGKWRRTPPSGHVSFVFGIKRATFWTSAWRSDGESLSV